MTGHTNSHDAEHLPKQTEPNITPLRSTKEKVKSLGRETKEKTKEKTKRLLRRRRSGHEEREDEKGDSPCSIIQDDPAFDPAELIGHKKRMSISGSPSQIASGLYSGLKALANPANAAKRKAATKVAVEDRPYLSREADMEFLDAHDKLSNARTKPPHSRSSGEQSDVREQRDRVETLENLRMSRKIAWTTSRHIKRVLVSPKHDFPPPKKEDYYVVDAKSGQRRLDWWAWFSARQFNAMKGFAVNSLGNVDFAGQAPFDRDILSGHMERVLIASSPWQSWLASLRSLYRWEDPAKTRKWFAIWCVVWYFNCVVIFTLVYTVFVVLENRFRPKQVEAMRESYERSLSQGTAAFRFNELIQKHGSGQWLDPVVEAVGPVAQLQLSDLADFLESLNNFYDWRDPKKTWATLFWFLCAILTGLLTPTGYSLKLIWMYCILGFFISRPVASMHPEYRHVVNGPKWIFWDVPNDAEFSMQYLRKKAQETREALIARRVQEKYDNETNHPPDQGYVGNLDVPKITRTTSFSDSASSSSGGDVDDADSYHTVESTTSILGGLDIMSFRCSHHAIPGRLVISTGGLRFQRVSPLSSMRKEAWQHGWTDIVEMCKVSSRITKSEGISFSFTDGSEAKLDGVRRRDKAFNCVLGFSGLRYQVLDMTAEFGCHDKTMSVGGEFQDA